MQQLLKFRNEGVYSGFGRRLVVGFAVLALLIQGLMLVSAPLSRPTAVQAAVLELTALAGPAFDGAVLCVDVTNGDENKDVPNHEHGRSDCAFCQTIGHALGENLSGHFEILAFVTSVAKPFAATFLPVVELSTRLNGRPRGPPFEA